MVVTPGDYQVSFLDDPAPITIRGIAGQPRPRLHFSGPFTEGLRLNYGSTLRYVELDVLPGSQKSALTARNASVEQVLAKGPG